MGCNYAFSPQDQLDEWRSCAWIRPIDLWSEQSLQGGHFHWRQCWAMACSICWLPEMHSNSHSNSNCRWIGETSLCPQYVYVHCERLSDYLGPNISLGDWAHGTLQDVGSEPNLSRWLPQSFLWRWCASACVSMPPKSRAALIHTAVSVDSHKFGCKIATLIDSEVSENLKKSHQNSQKTFEIFWICSHTCSFVVSIYFTFHMLFLSFRNSPFLSLRSPPIPVGDQTWLSRSGRELWMPAAKAPTGPPPQRQVQRPSLVSLGWQDGGRGFASNDASWCQFAWCLPKFGFFYLSCWGLKEVSPTCPGPQNCDPLDVT